MVVFEFLSVDINFFKRKLLPPLPILFMIITLNFLALTLTFEKFHIKIQALQKKIIIARILILFHYEDIKIRARK